MKVEMIHSSSWSTGDRIGTCVVGILLFTIIGLIGFAISEGMTSNRLEEEFSGREISIPAKEEMGIGFVTGIKDGKLLVYFPDIGMVPLEENMVRIEGKKKLNTIK